MTTANDTQLWEFDHQITREDEEEGRIGHTYRCTYDLDCDAKAVPVRKFGHRYWGGAALCEDHAAMERFAV